MERLSGKVAESTRSGWRDLGFFYVSDDHAKEWILTGSRSGLLGFAEILRQYSTNPRYVEKSEHDHFGPHMYLEVMTWPDAGIDGHSIHGRQEDIARLAELVEARISQADEGSIVSIRDEYSPGAETQLCSA